MFIQEFHNLCARGESMQVDMPRPNLILDPRVNDPCWCIFECHYHDDGITVTLTRVDDDLEYVSGYVFKMRVFDPEVEVLPDFNSTTYTYLGVDGEYAPADTIIGIIDPSVKTIREDSFNYCKKMTRCIMHANVEIIEGWAFWECHSLEALFLPSSLREIDPGTFNTCRNIRILSLPLGIGIEHIGGGIGGGGLYEIVRGCDTFFRITQIQKYERNDDSHFNGNQVHQAILDFNRNLNPMYKACLDTNVSAQTIQECILANGTVSAYNTDYDGMTPLHILALNPHATTGSIQTCFGANMSAAFVRDGTDKTPLDTLLEYGDIESHSALVTALCMCRMNATRGERIGQSKYSYSLG